MTSDVKIPEWARLEGERRAMELVPAMALTYDHSHGLKDYDNRKAAELPFRLVAQHEVGPAIALALTEAEQRRRKAGLEEIEQAFKDGVEYASIVAVPNTDEGREQAWSISRAKAAAIRSLGEQECG